MTKLTVLLLVASFLIAGVLSYFQYIYKAKNKSRIDLFLAFLRFMTFFCVFVLLINPTITKNNLTIEKPILAIAVDNSSSISFLNAAKTSREIYQKIVSNAEILDKFEIQSFQFDSDVQASERFNFKGNQTKIDVVANALKNNNKNRIFPTILLTDGNQTTGNDFVFSFDPKNSVYPIILGDTTQLFDLKINQLNVNKYAFHKNKFPVEVFLNYSGSKSVTASCTIWEGNTKISTQNISFSASKKTAIIPFLLPANAIGTVKYKAVITSKEFEKNKFNNTKNFAVEILNKKTNIAIVSAITHPDIAALKRGIESNAQRKVIVIKPQDIKSLGVNYIFILYQPTSEFKSVFDFVKKAAIPTFIITGNYTNFDFLNGQQSNLFFKMSNQKEDYSAEYNSDFSLFSIEDIGFGNFPPLENPFGSVKTNGNVSFLLSSKIRNLKTNTPLLAFADNQGQRTVFLLGENCWKWRLQTHIENQSFSKFDLFLDKIIQYLATNNTRQHLIVTHETFYNLGGPIEISAQYFDKNYEFDEKAELSIAVKNTKTKQTKTYDLLKGNSSFNVQLGGLSAGNYTFLIKELHSKSAYSGRFEVIDFDIEKQFVNPDIEKLTQLASLTQGKIYFPKQVDSLIKKLIESEKYKAIQKSNRNKTPLIDWIWLLILILISLTTEWFIRKYNGLL